MNLKLNKLIRNYYKFRRITIYDGKLQNYFISSLECRRKLPSEDNKFKIVLTINFSETSTK